MNRIGWVVVLISLCHCGQEREKYVLRLQFDTDELKQETQTLKVFVIEPAELVDCTSLLSGTAAGYRVETNTTIALRETGEPSAILQRVGRGERLFYVEGNNELQVKIVHGCTEALAGDKETDEVIVKLIAAS